MTILEYLMHESTWKGLIAVGTAAGVSLRPEMQTAILSAGMGAIGLIQILMDDADKDALKDALKKD